MTTKPERQLQDQLNRVRKLLPGLQRVYELENIVARLEADIEMLDSKTPDDRRLAEDDVLFLKRLAWDLHELRRAVNPHQQHNSRDDSDNWPRGPRP